MKSVRIDKKKTPDVRGFLRLRSQLRKLLDILLGARRVLADLFQQLLALFTAILQYTFLGNVHNYSRAMINQQHVDRPPDRQAFAFEESGKIRESFYESALIQ
jgi:hypothetical protein